MLVIRHIYVRGSIAGETLTRILEEEEEEEGY